MYLLTCTFSYIILCDGPDGNGLNGCVAIQISEICAVRRISKKMTPFGTDHVSPTRKKGECENVAVAPTGLRLRRYHRPWADKHSLKHDTERLIPEIGGCLATRATPHPPHSFLPHPRTFHGRSGLCDLPGGDC